MEKMILIPEEQYYKMQKTYDEVVEKLNEIKELVKKYENGSQK